MAQCVVMVNNEPAPRTRYFPLDAGAWQMQLASLHWCSSSKSRCNVASVVGAVSVRRELLRFLSH